jgi:hypothetical protein
MAKIPLPERGQPIDVSYIYQITNAVNELSDANVTTNFGFASIDVAGEPKKTLKTSALRVIGGRVNIATTSRVADSTESFTYNFGSSFEKTPIVTATVSTDNASADSASAAATVVLTDVNTNTVTGLVRFNKSGNAGATINLIIIGASN